MLKWSFESCSGLTGWVPFSRALQSGSRWEAIVPERRFAGYPPDAIVKDASGVEMRLDVPIIGFARRMTAYKRPDLLFTNLERLTEPTGGRALFPDRRTLRPTAEYLAAELRNQYALAVAPAPSEKGAGWHDLKVTVKERRDGSGRKVKFEARVRRGFYDEGARRAGATP